MKLAKFTEHDWNAWAGAEGDAYIGHADKATVIADDVGVCVYYGDDGCWHLATENAEAVTSLINFDAVESGQDLESLGFERVN